jgi:hypothetical protein
VKKETVIERNKKFQREQVRKLRAGKTSYFDASIYTILFDLVEGNGLDEVTGVLHNLAHDLGRREELETIFDDTKKYQYG